MLWFSIELVEHAIKDIGENMTPGVRRILTLIAGIRRWTFLPSLVTTVARVMFVKGADSVRFQILSLHGTIVPRELLMRPQPNICCV